MQETGLLAQTHSVPPRPGPLFSPLCLSVRDGCFSSKSHLTKTLEAGSSRGSPPAALGFAFLGVRGRSAQHRAITGNGRPGREQLETSLYPEEPPALCAAAFSWGHPSELDNMFIHSSKAGMGFPPLL